MGARLTKFTTSSRVCRQSCLFLAHVLVEPVVRALVVRLLELRALVAQAGETSGARVHGHADAVTEHVSSSSSASASTGSSSGALASVGLTASRAEVERHAREQQKQHEQRHHQQQRPQQQQSNATPATRCRHTKTPLLLIGAVAAVEQLSRR